jgi:glycosyltransferase involved in cell wall biosynthesis
VHICTIIARNYLPAARVLARSFREHHPDGRISVLILDDLYGDVHPHEEPFEVLRPSQLPIDADEFHRMAMIYELMELATAVKPWLLRQLLTQDDGGVVAYLDPDIRVYAPLDEVSSLAQRYGIVLTPHVTAPMPRDGRKVDESTILSSGIYNLGFIALGQDTRPFLEFWMERLRRDCHDDKANMRFVDQRWIDFVPGIFDCHVLRDPGYNVAYWNLDHRELRWTEAGYEVDGRPLRFFHFSGFDVTQPYLLSKHQAQRPRILLSERPDVARICREYAGAIRDCTLESEVMPAYAFARLPNGLPIETTLRKLFKQRLVDAEAADVPLPDDPFSLDGASDFVTWLNSPPQQPGARVSRYLSFLHTRRPDLQAAFPDPEGGDYQRFFRWAHDEVEAGRLHPLLAPLRESASRPTQRVPSWAPSANLRPGVCVAGYLRAELGVGEHGRLMFQAVKEAGLEAGTFVFDGTASRQNYPFPNVPTTDLNVNLVAVNADELGNFVNQVGTAFFDGRYTIGMWAWELEEFPAHWYYAFDHVDEVWANSEFSRRAFAAATDKPVYAFPLPIVEPRPRPHVDRAALGLPDGFLFLFCFDFFSTLARKNPDGLIEAFSAAFAPGEGPILVLKGLNGELRLPELEKLKLLAGERPDVVILDRYLDHDENAALMSACDCYVSLHRSEGFGLTMAEAMALGKPVIATGYSGNLDFMDERTAYLVPYRAGAVPEGCAPYPAGARWAEPDLDVAAQLMRRVVEHRLEATELGARGRRAVLTKHGLVARAGFVRERFDHAQRSLAARARVRGASGESAAPRLVALARSRADIASPTPHRWVSRPVRRVMARLTAHGDAHRAEVDAQLAEALVAVETRVGELDSALKDAATRSDAALSVAQNQGAYTASQLVQIAASHRRLAEQLAGVTDRVGSRMDDLAQRYAATEEHVRDLDAATGARLQILENQFQAIDALLRGLPYVSGRWVRQSAGGSPPDGAQGARSLVGNIDQPVDGAHVEADAMLIGGWAAINGRAAARVEVFMDGESVGAARLRLPRPDVAAAFPYLGHLTGFECRAEVRVQARRTAQIGVEVVGFDGSRGRLPSRSVRLYWRTTSTAEAERAAALRLRGGGVPLLDAGAGKSVDEIHALVFAHSLELGGAQLYLNELLRRLVPALHRCTVVSPTDGVVRNQLEALGVDVIVTGPTAPLDIETYEGRVRELCLFIRGLAPDVIMVNTLAGFAAADAAERDGIPTIWTIHEAYTLEEWLDIDLGRGRWHPYVRDRLAAALAAADRVVFVTQATTRLFGSYTNPARRVVVKYGVDTDAIQGVVRSTSRLDARTRHGVEPSARVLLSVAMVHESKSQACLIEGFAEVAPEHPEAVLAIVGDRRSGYSKAVHHLVDDLGLPGRVLIVPATPDVAEWYILSDLLVSASDQECLPRTFLEAMAFGLPILSTDVGGVRDVIEDGRNGWLFPPRDIAALIDSLRHVLRLTVPELRVAGKLGRSMVEKQRGSAGYALAYRALIEEVVGASPTDQARLTVEVTSPDGTPTADPLVVRPAIPKPHRVRRQSDRRSAVVPRGQDGGIDLIQSAEDEGLSRPV